MSASNKWGTFKERLSEQRRIFESVREEHIEIIQHLDDSRNELESLQHKIPPKKDELTELELKIEELKLAARELKDRRNVRLYLPHKPLWPSKRIESKRTEDSVIGTGNAYVSVEESFDFSRCSISTRFPIHVYPRETFAQKHMHSLYEQLQSSPYRTNNPTQACLFVALLEGEETVESLSNWNKIGRNHLLLIDSNKHVNTSEYGAALIVANAILGYRQQMDNELLLNVDSPTSSDWLKLPALLPYDIKYLISYQSTSILPAIINDDLKNLAQSAIQSLDNVLFDSSCIESDILCGTKESRLKIIKESAFTLIFDNQPLIQHRLFEALEGGSIPVLMSTGHFHLPFNNLIDWRLATIKLPLARLTELHFILRSFSLSDRLEMRRKGRFLLENYLLNTRVLSRAILSSIRYSLQIPGENEAQVIAQPAFEVGFNAPEEVVPTAKINPYDDEYLGPVEAPVNSPSYNHNMTSMGLYAHEIWNTYPNLIDVSPEFLSNTAVMPSGIEFDDQTNAGMRPVLPGSGQEFSLALGGNRLREQFTVVLLTHNRDAVLFSLLERLNRCPYLNKVLVIWNNLDRKPPNTWPKLHVPLMFIHSKTNSLNNRFLPYDQIETEAVLSMDDDIDLKQHEIVMAFRVWRENRERIVGFPARYHARYDNELYYNSNHTCQYSMILTGAAFLHKSYFYGYTNQMPAIIREKVDEWMNCEDLAMNFFVSHLTRRPPIKTTSKWTLRCPTCIDNLSADDNHFNKRHNCIRFFIQVYGYNPLLFTQFRADSVLFKTRVPENHQKCFKYV